MNFEQCFNMYRYSYKYSSIYICVSIYVCIYINHVSGVCCIYDRWFSDLTVYQNYLKGFEETQIHGLVPGD